jgi:hypothetical protein
MAGYTIILNEDDFPPEQVAVRVDPVLTAIPRRASKCRIGSPNASWLRSWPACPP